MHIMCSIAGVHRWLQQAHQLVFVLCNVLLPASSAGHSTVYTVTAACWSLYWQVHPILSKHGMR
jgi:hypothetical protein